MPPILWTVPQCRYSEADGYDHCPRTSRRVDSEWNAITSTGSWLSGMLRLLTGYRVDSRTVSRSPVSWVSLDGSSIGIAHHHSGTIPKWLSAMVRACPGQAAWAWGKETAQKMRSAEWLSGQIPNVRGDMRHPSSLDWLLSGWYEISPDPGWIAAQVYFWGQNYIVDGAELCHEFGWTSAMALAATVRLVNSKGKSGARTRIESGIEATGSLSQEMVLEWVYLSDKSEGGYDHPGRWEKLHAWPAFSGAAPGIVDVALELDLNVRIIRPDGSEPEWARRGVNFPIPVMEPIVTGFSTSRAISSHLERKGTLQRLEVADLIAPTIILAGLALIGRNR